MSRVISVDHIIISEYATPAVFTVRLSEADLLAPVTVHWSLSGVTATSGSDYGNASGVLTFSPGIVEQTVNVAILNDGTPERPETFALILSSPSTNAVIGNTVATATIIDNDAPAGTPVVTINDFVVDESGKEASFVVTLDRPSTGVVSMSYATQDGGALAGSDYVATSGSLNFAAGETAKTVKVTLLNDTASESSEAFNLVLSALTGATSLDPVGTAIIAENDASPVSTSNISVDDIVVGESQTYADFLVRLDQPNSGTITVHYQTYYGTANSLDFVAQGGSLTFAAGEMVKTVRVTLTNDTTAEPTENFTLYLSGASANATIARDTATATIIDNDATSGTPVVTINDFVVDESGKEASFVVTLDRPSTGVVSMSYATQDGGALAGSDYVATSGSLNFAPGETAKTVKVTLLNDTLPEPSEAFNLVLSALTGATSLDPVGTAIIAENDASPVSTSNISVDDIVVGESQTYADFLVRLDQPNSGTITVHYQTYYGTANSLDFVAQGGSLTFAAGEMVKTVRVTLTNDTTAEPTENFTLYLSGASANATIARDTATATIIDNDATSGTPVVTINDFVVDESGKEASFVVTLDRPSTGVVSMSYATQDGGALAGSDYVATSGSLNFAPGETAKTVKVTLLNDTLPEPSEAFNLVLSALTGATTLDPVGTAIIAENDASPVSTSNISVDDIVVGESQTYADFLVRLDQPNSGTITVHYQTYYGTANSLDFVAQGGSLTFAAGEMVKTVRVTLTNDTTAEPTENFTLYLSGASANATIARDTATATIIDNDATSGTPVVTINDFVVDESGKEASFVVTLDRPSTGVVSMSYATQDGGALAGSDYVATSGSLNFAPGETAKTVKVTLLNDTLPEPSEAFNLVLSALTGATTLDPVGTAIIAENDASPVSTSNISVDDIVVGESQTYADFLVRLDQPNSGTITVHYQTYYGTANSLDFVAQGGSLTFAAGEMVKTVRVTLTNDTTAEPTENFTLYLSGASANATIARDTATATIIDNDATSGTPVVTINDFVVDESGKEASFVVTLDRPSTGVVSMSYATQDGGALAGSDYVATSGSLNFAPGETAKTVKVTLLNDTLPEPSEAFNLVLSALTGATTLDPVGTAIIAENDASPVSTSNISVDDIVVGESQTYADFLVRLDQPNSGTITVHYQTYYGTANSLDFVAQGGSLTFAAGEMVKTVRVTLTNDTTAEPTENFTLYLSGASANATIARNTATATIIDNDATSGTPVVRVGDTVVDESSGLVQVALVLDRPSAGNVTVSYDVRGVTAAPGSDFTIFPGQGVGFAPGETVKWVAVGIADDATQEQTEAFDVAITAATGATIGTTFGHVLISRNDEATVATPVVNLSNVLTVEGGGYVDFVATLNAPTGNVVRVSYQTYAGTAASGVDFVAQSGSLTFAPGETTRTIRLTIADDVAVEALENFTLQLQSPVNATLGNAVATATIIDNDGPAPVSVNLAGTAAADILRGSPFADIITGGAGNDVLVGGSGSDTLTGGTGDDIYYIEDAGDTYTEALGEGTDLVISYLPSLTLGANVENLQLAGNAVTGVGNSSDNRITGTAGNNTLEGGAGNDTLIGGDGSDFIRGNSGVDSIDGGAGLDTASYEDAPSGIVIDLATGIATNNGEGQAESVLNVENVHGSAFSDVIQLSATNGYVFGRAGNDSIASGSGSGQMYGGSGNDTLNGSAGVFDTAQYFDDGYDTAGVSVLGVTVNLQTGNATDNWGFTDTLIGIENVAGSAFADSITGDGAANHLSGDAGNDTLIGGAGNDFIRGGSGVDSIDGGAGLDTASYEDAPSGIVINLLTGIATNNGEGQAESVLNMENVHGSAFSDQIQLSATSGYVFGRAGSDSITGGAGDDNLIGGSGSDTLNGGAGGFDTANYFADGYDTAGPPLQGVTVNLLTGTAIDNWGFTDTLIGIENVRGGALADTITGDAATNGLSGDGGNDTLNGGDGNDFLLGGSGSDTINGGAGTDFAQYLDDGYDHAGLGTQGVIVNLTTGVAIDNWGFTDTLISIENVSGSGLADTITGDAAANNLHGNAGNDTIDGLGGNDSLNGGDGHDSLSGGGGHDQLRGDAGNDTLVGGDGNDYMTGGSGNDSLLGGSGVDTADYFFSDTAGSISVNLVAGTATGGGGNDTLSGIENVNGSDFADTITGDAANNLLEGRGGNDILLGGGGADTLVGGAGNDTLDGGVVTDRIRFGDDVNAVDYRGSANGVVVNVSGITGDGSTGSGTADDGLGGTDTLINISRVFGSNHNDSITGSSALMFEVFSGGAGNDTIDGGAVTDTLNGDNTNAADYFDAAAAVTVNLGNGTATGGAGNDQLLNMTQARGSANDDVLIGSDNTLVREHFEGRGGNDTIDGAGGIDLVRHFSATAGVRVNLATGIATSLGADAGIGTDTLSNIEGIRGSAYADSLTGGNAASSGLEFFEGLEGNDTIDGGGGYDRVEYVLSRGAVNVTLGGAGIGTASGDASVGTDTLIGIEGVRGSAFGDVLTGSNDAAIYETFEGREGNDTINGMGGIDQVVYHASRAGVTVNLTTGTASDGYGSTDLLSNIEDVLGSRDFSDSIVGNGGHNRLEGQGGNDTLQGGLGNDTVDGGAGTDSASYADASAGVTVSLATPGVQQNTVNAGVDTLIGIEHLIGSGFNDALTGDAGHNALQGGAGNDTLQGGLGNDTVDGGAGTDSASYADASAGVSVTLATPGVQQNTVNAGLDTMIGMENLIGSGFNDALTGDASNNALQGGGGNDTLQGGLGNDTVDGGAGTDSASYADASAGVSVTLATPGVQQNTVNAGLDTLIGIENLIGSGFNDTLTGDASNNALQGGGGNDTLQGGLGNDTVDGGAGTDSASYADAGAGVSVTLATPGVQQNTVNAGLDTLIGIEHLIGSGFNDALTGEAGNNALQGGAGNDTLQGGLGNDTVDGGAGTDSASYADATAGVTVTLATPGVQQNTVNAGLDTLIGIEHLIGSGFNDALTGDAGNNALQGGGGNDTLQGGLGNDTVDGGAGTDSASYADATAGVTVTLATPGVQQNTVNAGLDTLIGIEHLIGSGFNDALTGDASNNALQGGAGNDTLQGGLGNDTVDGGAGTDSASYADASAGVSVTLATPGVQQNTVNAGLDTLIGIENLIGSGFNDALTGEAGNNALQGGGGNDTLQGGLGNDTVDGGAGTDSASYADATAGVTVTLATPGVQQNTVNAGLDTLIGIENLIGSGFNDTLTGDASNNALQGGGGNDTLQGGLGNDTVDGGAGTDSASYADATAGVTVTLATPGVQQNTVNAGLDTLIGIENLIGSGFNDALTGDASNNALQGGGGNDTLQGGLGNDTVDGGAGTDSASYADAGAGVSVTLATPGVQQNTVNAGLDTLIGIEHLIGSGFNDALTGDAGHNALQGGAGNDTLQGGLGNDTVDGGAGTDSASYADATAGVTVTLATPGVQQNTVNAGLDTLIGIEHLIGSGFNDALTGEAGNNALQGGAGNDTLQGGLGNDTVDGGAGTDSASYADASAGVTVTLATPGVQQNTVNAGLDTLIGIENLIGSGFNDALTGEAGNNALQGGGGNDTLQGGLGNDTVDGGAGTDSASYADASAGVTVTLATPGVQQNTVNAGLDTLIGIEHLIGSGFNDALTGDAGNNALQGGAGNDTLQGGTGADTLTGGDGNDFYYIDHIGDQVIETNAAAAGGTDLVHTTLASYTLGNHVENGRILASGAANLTGNALNNLLYAGTGDNLLDGGAGSDTVTWAYAVSGASGVTASLASGTASGSGSDTLTGIEHLIGSANADRLTGDGNANNLSGGLGNDTLDGGAGADTLTGGDGSDFYYIDHIGDQVIETSASAAGGTDLVHTTLASYTLGNHVENGRILAAGAANLTGNALNNLLYAGTGNNVLDGGAGSDTVTWAYAVIGAAGVTASLASGTASGSGLDTLIGIEHLIGSANADRLTGDGNANNLSGGLGNDTLDGGAGADTLTGGDGSDFYYVDHAGDQVIETNATAAGGTDLVHTTLASYTLGNHVENGRILASGAANLTGNALNNLLYAGTGNNLLDGGAGSDTVTWAYAVIGAAGVTASLASGTASGSGLDTLIGIEHLIGSANADRLTGDGNANNLSGGLGNDTLDGGAGADTLTGGDGSDFYYIDHIGDQVIETNAAAAGGTDLVHTTLATYTLGNHVENGRILASGAANLTGNALNNLLYAGTGNNLLDGGAGSDTVTWAYAVIGAAGVTASLASGTASGSGLDTLSGIEHLIGSANADRLTGDGNANNLSGGLGNDTLDGGAGADTLTGGDGSDFYYIDHIGDQVIETNAAAAGGTDLVHTTLATYTLGNHVENGRILASGAANLTGNALNNLLYAGTGNNLLDGGAGSDTVTWAYGVSGATGVTASLASGSASGSGSDTLIGIEHLIGSPNADRLTGDGNANHLSGGLGNDTLDGGAGADTLTGGDGSDFYYIDHIGDQVIETNAAAAGGTDLVHTTLATYTLGNHVENGRILASGAANLTGNALNNLLYAGTGNNLLDGGAGSDTVTWAYGVSGATGVTASLASGSASGSGSDTLIGIEHLIGSPNADRLTGDGNANHLSGGLGNDTLDGGSGADTLAGGDGNDDLSGGLGADVFRFDTLPNATTNRDTILDFSVVDDTIQLENAIFSSLAATGTLAAGSFRSGAGVTAAADADDFVIYDTTSGALYYDASGNTGAGPVQIASLSSGLLLTSLDFLVT